MKISDSVAKNLSSRSNIVYVLGIKFEKHIAITVPLTSINMENKSTHRIYSLRNFQDSI